MTYTEKEISYADYVRLRESVNWNNFFKEQTEKCLKNTLYSIEVIDDNTIIGMGRLIGDGMYYMMVDIIVEPSYQGKGIGSNIVNNSNFPRGCKKSCVYGEKSFLIGIRYVEIHCQISLLLCCRNSFLIIVLPVYLFLYTYIKFFAHQSGISRKEILCGRCPHPASRIRLDISGNTANADGIRPGHS